MHRAKELVLLADVIDAAEAERIGLVNRVVPHDRLAQETRELAHRLTRLPPLALALSKRLLDQSPSMSMAQAIESENAAQALIATSKDTAEAILAFLEGRDPIYTGE
jgi:2-(1,2-epoxy-1,2-dihydrophenyl)acetyl-CoA isomerase